MGEKTKLPLLLLLIYMLVAVAQTTNNEDFKALVSLTSTWQNKPLNWEGSSDPCNDGWDGIECTKSRVTSIFHLILTCWLVKYFRRLTGLNIKGELSEHIGLLSELETLDLSHNKGLTGSLPHAIGDLRKLSNLFLVDCGFTGPIPDEIGSLKELVFLSLNSNRFSGGIPASIGNLTKLNWLDIADNELEGSIPISSGNTPGLDMLLRTKHFHFGKNKLSGIIPPQLFSSEMNLIHVLFENNQFEGNIPSTLGLVQSLEVLRLDNNLLSGHVPLNINNLTDVYELDMSNNSFDESDFPAWISTLKSLSTLKMENTGLEGQIPDSLFSLSKLRNVILKDNRINGSLDLGNTYSNQLRLIDLQNNKIDNFKQQDMVASNVKIILVHNPVCEESGVTKSYCSNEEVSAAPSTTTMNCEPASCSSGQVFSAHCKCSYPYTGALRFRTPSFLDWGNETSLQERLMHTFQSCNLPVDSVSLSPRDNYPSQYLEFTIQIFPSSGDYFNQEQILSICSALSNLTMDAFYFYPDEYGHFEKPTESSKSSNSGIIIRAAICGGSALLVLLLLAGGYAFWQKKKAEKAIQQNYPFGREDPSDSNSSIPQLKGIRRFSFEELQKYTNKFSQDNDIGSGGYGKVYRGILPNGKLIAIKRGQKESMQGRLQFKAEIELLSRVHHKNLVSLVGFCFERGEEILVYEYVSNGTLKDAILGKSVIRLDWIRRLKIALDIARGLDYLHQHANPPIIHRDIKSSNILLDERLNAKVADFGLSKPMVDFEKDHVTTQVKGTMGYLDPEYYTSQQLTEKSDVYSYGVLMLELITAKKPIERGKYIVKVVRSEIDKAKDLYGLEKILDPTIGLGSTLKGFEMFVNLAMKCVEDSRPDRPTMNDVVKEIESVLESAGLKYCSVESTSSSYDELMTTLLSLKDTWENTPPNWVGLDPCDDWEGIKCKNSRVTSITLASTGLAGQLSGDIGSLSKLETLDLSFNKDLTGSLPQSIGELKKLSTLILVGCSFNGPIPDSIGNLQELLFLSLNSNRFSGQIPHSIGNLSKLHWLDLADNQLQGDIPVSSDNISGLDKLHQAKHFHLGKNNLSGSIPPQLFSWEMALIHVLLESNQLTGNIPPTLGLVQSLEVVRLDSNSLSGPVPPNINNLTNVQNLYLSNNKLSGSLPNLTGLNALSYLEMSNNSFKPLDFPVWFSTLESLTTLVLKDNKLNGTLDIGSSYSNQLRLVDLETNSIEIFEQKDEVSNVKIILKDNPICEEIGEVGSYCFSSLPNVSYSTAPNNCEPGSCSSEQIPSPNCICAYPYSGIIAFRSLSFTDLDNKTYFVMLEEDLMQSFKSHFLPVDSVLLSHPSIDSNQYLKLSLQVFPSGQDHFNRTGAFSIGFMLSSQSFDSPQEAPSKSSNIGVIIGAAVGGSVLLLLLLLAALYALRQKKRAEKVIGQSNPFKRWDTNHRNSEIPQLKEARMFSFEDLKKYTKNFSQSNDVGSGGFGKVYKGTLPNGQVVAIKRAQKESMQGKVEFKAEIELLSRVHHKNLVSLMGFCFEQGEQMLVYEYVPNGSLKDALSGKSGIRLDWIRRLKVALGAARGLAYLHELANPPIIHRDIKSNNILLDDCLNAKVSDFGLSKSMVDRGKDHVTTQVKGTMGYLDPEYYMSQQLSEKSDVYSFGVLMMELISARRPLERGKYIVKEVRKAFDRTKDLYGLHEIIDPAIGLTSTLSGFDKFVDMTLKCVEESSAERPKMSDVVREIENILKSACANTIDESPSISSSYEDVSRGSSTHPYNTNYTFDSMTTLLSLMDSLKNTPPTWAGSDPCDDWEGIKCKNSRVTTLSSIGLVGQLSGDIGALSELETLDLSYNKDLTGPLPESIGELTKLSTLSLNSNSFSGPIPHSIGNLSKLSWLDLAENQLQGNIPVSSGDISGLDKLHHAKHLLLESNQLIGNIPSTLGLVQSLEVVRLDSNSLSGPVPPNINNLTHIQDLYLSNNKLSGSLPNLTGLNALSYLDMSNNSFNPLDFPEWFSTLESLTTLKMERTQLQGQVPTSLFTLVNLQTVVLKDNNINGTLDIGSSYSNNLRLVDLETNSIDSFEQKGVLNVKIILKDNPICQEISEEGSYCSSSQPNISYSTAPNNCEPVSCSSEQISSPNCICAYPYSGILTFRSPSLSDFNNKTYYLMLEEGLMQSFKSHFLPVDSVLLSHPSKDSTQYLDLSLQVFPSGQDHFNRTGTFTIGFLLSNQTFKPPKVFGPFYFLADKYEHFGNSGAGLSKSSNIGIIIGAAVGGSVFLLLLLLAGLYAFRQKKRAEKAIGQSNPFRRWDTVESNTEVPQLKEARMFSFEDLKKYTKNFSQSNDVGSGGFGKVYKGTLPNGQVVAIKRAQKESMQGKVEFKAEIELLSRVHHKNLVSLIGFCFEQGEQMLVYEYVPNGSLKDALSGKSGIRLDWIRRLKVALGTARGLAYLHELVNPPIIHRDIKSNNILLDDRLNAKVADFGLSKSMVDSEKDHVTTQVKGTMGYLDPEYYMSQQLSEKSDVYSFGVLMMELISARRPLERGKYIVKEVKNALDRTKGLYGLHEIIDPAIGLASTLSGFDKFVDMTLKCVEESSAERPKMSDVVREIENILKSAGANTIDESPSTSSSYENVSRGSSTHPYNTNDTFDFSAGLPYPKVDPKNPTQIVFIYISSDLVTIFFFSYLTGFFIFYYYVLRLSNKS
ncbi:putative leucine-rich repeat receptor-like protein kinase, partial [Mucuna pruriens]